jgi:hypothetical protein
MTEIFCKAGGIVVNLPEGAFDQSLLAPAVVISPCDGCGHSGHAQKALQITREVRESEEMGVHRVPHLEHRVQVIKAMGKEHVQCTCCCYPETVSE